MSALTIDFAVPQVHVSAATRPPVARDAASFAAQLGDRLAGTADAGAADDLREPARQLVATTFIEPVLALARESSAAEGPFAPGPAERRFGSLLDQNLADGIVRSENFPLVDEIERRLARLTGRDTSVSTRGTPS